MISTQALFEQIQLAEASYSLLGGLTLGNDDALRSRLLLVNKDDFNGEFSDAQATALVSRWGVTNHQVNTASGFSATLFSSKERARNRGQEIGVRSRNRGQVLQSNILND